MLMVKLIYFGYIYIGSIPIGCCIYVLYNYIISKYICLIYKYNMFNIYMYTDAATPWQIGFQNSASPIHEGIVELHNSIFYYLVVIFVFVFVFLISTGINYTSNKNVFSYKYLNHNTILELIWTITPAFVLIAIAFPSFKLLYIMDEVVGPSITIKVNAHQWYWNYEYCDYLNSTNSESINFDSYMVPDTDLEVGDFRVLEVDQNIVIPNNTMVRFIVTSYDVIHSFAVPALGIKIDAIPGRLNQVTTYTERTGLFYGQCSELCGIAHFGMPIVVHSVNIPEFIVWLNNQLIILSL